MAKGCEDDGSCTQSGLLAAGQYMTCPSEDYSDCGELPDVINYSWGVPNIECYWYDDVIQFWKRNNLTFALSIRLETLVLTAQPPLVRDVILTYWPLEPSISTGILQVSAAAGLHMMVAFTLTV